MRALAAIALLSTTAFAADSHEMLREWLTRLANEQLSDRSRKVAAIQTAEQVRARGAESRQTLLRMLGGLPKERTPLNVRRTGVLDRGDYRVEKLIFESMPKVYVTANLYIPQTGKPPYPAVIHPTGHSTSAKARAFYQTLSLGLVKSGFVVLTYDPLGQGERRLFYDPMLEDSRVGGTVIEHQIVGIQSMLMGESVARYMVWDGMRGVDLLQSRPEVDPQRIGVAGCSGGGTLTAYLAALDDRLKVAASACYISNWEEQLKGTGPQDAEQQFPDQLRNGINHGDLILAAAPKPYLICSTEKDFFPLEGARQTFTEVKRLYDRMGQEDKIAWAVGPGGHGTPKNIREAIYGWMNRWLKQGGSAPVPEPEFQTEPEENLLATATGQLTTSLGGDNASTLNRKRYEALPPLKTAASELRTKVATLTRYKASTLGSVTEGEKTARDGFTLQKLGLEVEGRAIGALLATPDAARSRNRSLVYLDPAGRDAYAKEGSDFEQLARAGYTVLGIDPSGIGETSSRWAGYSSPWFGADRIITLALMVGRPLVGLHMDEILRGVDLLAARGLLPDGGCTALAKGVLTVDLLYAATLDERIREVHLEGGLLSYGAVLRSPIQRRVFEAVVPDALHHFDLPQLAATLAPRPLHIRGAVSAMGNPELLTNVRQAYQFTTAAYRAANAEGKFEVGLRREDEPITTAFPANR